MVLGRKLRHIIKDSRPRKVRISDSLPVRKNNLYNQIFIHQGSFFLLNVNRKIEKNYLCRRNFTCQIWEITQCKSIKTIFIDSNFLLHQNLHPYLLSTSTTLWVYIPYKVSCLEGLHITSTVDHSSRTRRSISAVLCASKGLDFSVLVHIPISQNDQVLTEIRSPSQTSPPGTSNKNLPRLENAPVDFGGLWRIEKAWFQCISTYTYLTKQPGTYRYGFHSMCDWWTQTCNLYYPSHQPVQVCKPMTFPGSSGWHWWVETIENEPSHLFARVMVILVSCIWK